MRLLGTLFAQTGRASAAIPLLERVVAAEPGDDDAHNNLAVALSAVGQLEGAIDHLREAIRIAPREAARYSNLAAILVEAGRAEEAVALLKPVARRFPRTASVHVGLGVAYDALDRVPEAVAALKAAMPLAPDSAVVCRNLGLLLARCASWTEAREHLKRARELAGEEVELLLHLGAAHYNLGELAEAEACFRAVLTQESGSVMARSNLAAILRERGELVAASALLEEAIARDPACAEAHANLANCQVALGEVDTAAEHDDRAIALQPDDLALGSQRLSRLLYRTEMAPEAIAAEHRRWGEAAMARVTPVARPAWDGACERPLRIGYLSPDLRRHSVATFLEPILAHHDPQAVAVTCFSNVARPDAVSERLRQLVPRWREIRGLTDEAAAQVVADDGIDVLVDLAGHTSRHRLGIFSRHPAPVQVTYLGYDATSGLPAIDFRITDELLDPDGFEAHYCERLWRLPSGRLCFQPSAEAVPVASPPCVEAGHVTFGSFNNLAKVGSGVVDLWARILHRVEGARLLLKHTALGEVATREAVRRRFADRGVDPTRLQLVGFTASTADHLALYRCVDIALDPFSYGGCTTTCEAVWMGVPVVTLVGDRAVGRYGISILSRLDLESLAADDADAYVEVAVSLAHDPNRLAALRHGLRDRITASTLCQPTRIARELERAYRGMAEALWREGRR